MSKRGGLINIGGDANDANYRYKMPPLQTKIEGRGNGIKTVLMNVVDVCKHLHTEPNWCTKFFGMEVGALSKFNTKRQVGIVHGVHQAADLQKHLKKYINEFILCPKCKQPELIYKVNSKKSLLVQKCMGCGEQGRNRSSHKVKTYMINNPPDPKQKQDKVRRQHSSSKQRRSGPTVSRSGSETVANDEEWTVSTDEKAVEERKQKELESLASKKKRANLSKLPGKENEGPVGTLRLFLLSEQRDTAHIIDEIRRLQIAHNLDENKKMRVTLEALLDPTTHENFIESIKKSQELFTLLIEMDGTGERFFNCLEEMIARRNYGALLPKTYEILFAIYDAEIATPDQIIQWFDKPADQAVFIKKDEAQEVRDKAKVFVDWLKEEDSGSEEEEDEEDEDGQDNKDDN